MSIGIDALHQPEIAVIGLLIVVVFDLHHLVAGTVDVAEAFDHRPVVRWVECFLEGGIQCPCSQPSSIHWPEHLHVSDRIKTEATSNSMPDHLEDLPPAVFLLCRITKL